MWPGLIQKAKEGGLDVIQTYVFWNGHEPQPGKYYFEGNYDLVKFIKLVKQAGLYVHLRIGPYVWVSLYGSSTFPALISDQTTDLSSLPDWAAKMALGLGTGVPWVMCKQDDAPDPIYHGGTDFGRTAGGPFIATSYDYDAPLDEYGLKRQPKWGDPTAIRFGHYEEAYNEETASDVDSSFTMVGLLEQINTTRDATDYLWYTTENGKPPVLTVLSAGHALHVLINGQLSGGNGVFGSLFLVLGSSYGSLEFPKITFSQGVDLRAGIDTISLLSIAVGLPIGLKGEALNHHSTTFNAPAGNDPLALDMNSMGKCQIWINGQSIGLHWPAYKASGNCGVCNYSGTFKEKKCGTNCGEASQRWYHVPQKTYSVCADIYEWQPTLMNYLIQASGKVNRPLRPKVHLECDAGQKILAVKFASFGTPEGSVEATAKEAAMLTTLMTLLIDDCSTDMFGGDPCPSVMKKLSVEVVCS
ncbi:putative RNA binding protein [Hibiscus syriacus]|uniref:beta-galactosidase n=1 Tax=Hibiscus syriacus TaxID=106335 RepID=A0A6A3A8E5_HIBSY|nr:putative RNA binding protein [Hibiscus syriacus]